MSYIIQNQSPAGINTDAVIISLRGAGYEYIPKYFLTTGFTAAETVDYSHNQVTVFDQDYTFFSATGTTIDMSDNPATLIDDTSNTFGALTLLKELYIRNLLCTDLSVIGPSFPSLIALEKIDATGGKLTSFPSMNVANVAFNYLSVRGNELPNAAIQGILSNLNTVLTTTTVMNGTLDLRGTFAFPQSPSWVSNYSGFTGTFNAGDLIDIQDIGNTVIAKGIVITQGGGQIKWETVWVSPTVPGTFTGIDNMVNTSQAGTITGAGAPQNDSGYIANLVGTYNWTVLLDVQ